MAKALTPANATGVSQALGRARKAPGGVYLGNRSTEAGTMVRGYKRVESGWFVTNGVWGLAEVTWRWGNDDAGKRGTAEERAAKASAYLTACEKALVAAGYHVEHLPADADRREPVLLVTRRDADGKVVR